MVSGIVTDEDGLPVNAIISSKDNSSQTNTKKNGSFAISLKKTAGYADNYLYGI
ncbi:hypothetical protein AAFH68_19650 [Flavobacterium sp. CGRL1]